jgi:hypothetical protein
MVKTVPSFKLSWTVLHQTSRVSVTPYQSSNAVVKKLISLILTDSLEMRTIEEPLDGFPAFYGTRRFITAFTRALHLSLS